MSDYFEDMMLFSFLAIMFMVVIGAGIAITCPECNVTDNASNETYVPVYTPPVYLFMHNLDLVGEIDNEYYYVVN